LHGGASDASWELAARPAARSSALATPVALTASKTDGLTGRKNARSSRDPRSPPFAPQPLRFGGLFGIDAPLTTKGETGAALAAFAVFGLRASLLPRRWDLAIFFSC
jgi:hypothetical protein